MAVLGETGVGGNGEALTSICRLLRAREIRKVPVKAARGAAGECLHHQHPRPPRMTASHSVRITLAPDRVTKPEVNGLMFFSCNIGRPQEEGREASDTRERRRSEHSQLQSLQQSKITK